MGMLSNLRDRLISTQDGKSGHGPWADANSGVVDAKPYVQYFSNGIFEGEDGSLWKYFKAPEDVRIEWLKDPEEAIDNQAFFVNVCQQLGMSLDAQTERVRNDTRRSFHIQITQTPFDGIKPYAGCTPAHADYLSRIASQYGKPVWHGFFGVQLLPGSAFYERHGFTDMMERYLELMRAPGGLQWDIYKADIDLVNAVMRENGFTEPDFSEVDDTAFEQLTAWHGVADRQYGLSRQLQSTRMQQPMHGLSMFVPKWGEIVFHAIKPADETRITDPKSEKSRWAKPLFSPSSDVVLINIRGEIRAPSISDNLLDLKRSKKVDENDNVKDLEDMHIIDIISLARQSVKDVKMPMLDNTEIIVGSMLPVAGGEPPIVRGIKRYGLQALPLVGRQHLGVLTSFPTYPRHVMRVPRGNSKRPELTNVMLPGILAFSGLWRNTGSCGPGGILMGLSDDLQYQEIYTEPDAAWKESRVPGMLITGRPGAGKTQQLLQMTAQLAYMGLPTFFFNPKKTGSLKSTFDHIGGATISMDRTYLASNPGVLDPIHFLTDRTSVADILSEALFTAAGKLGSEFSQLRTKLKSEITACATDTRNASSYDILLGNATGTTKGIQEPELRDFIEARILTSPVWRALISKTGEGTNLREKILSGKSVLIEWDNSMTLPDIRTQKSEYTDNQIDSLLSVNVAFQYASAAVSGTGGAIVVDEAWVLKASPESMNILERGGREWRQANIMLVLGTQKILDFMGTGENEVNMTTYFSRFLFMALQENDDLEMDAFFKATGLPREKAIENYILNAGRDTRRGVVRNPIPKAYYMDELHMWHGGIICGPWPEKELNLGRTDKGGDEIRKSSKGGKNEVDKVVERAGFSGVLAGHAAEYLTTNGFDESEESEELAV